MPMDARPIRDEHSCLLDLDDSNGRIEVGSISVHHQLPPCPRVTQSTVEFTIVL